MPKHWWEVPALKDVYQIRLDHLRKQMREQFQREYVRVGEAVPEAAYKEDAEPPVRARDMES